MGKEAMKKLSIGSDDYKELIESNCYYVDKTLFIKDVIDSANKINLICRPRRFGKTLNLSMLKYFFDCNADNKSLFVDKNIIKHPKYMSMLGKHPVIYFSFKDIKRLDWPSAYSKLVDQISSEFDKYVHAIDGLSDYKKRRYADILNKTASDTVYGSSLQFLSEVLTIHYKVKPIILIDEYDTPIHEAYANNYYKEAVDFLRTFFSSALKGNDTNLQLAVLTCVVPKSKEMSFFDLNKCDVHNFMLYDIEFLDDCL